MKGEFAGGIGGLRRACLVTEAANEETFDATGDQGFLSTIRGLCAELLGRAGFGLKEVDISVSPRRLVDCCWLRPQTDCWGLCEDGPDVRSILEGSGICGLKGGGDVIEMAEPSV